MVNKQIVDYLKKGLQKGFSRRKLKNKLLEVGWTKSQVNEALQQISGKRKKLLKKRTPQKKKPRRKLGTKKQKPGLVEKNKNKTNSTLLYIIIPVLAIAVIVLIFLLLPNKISQEDLEQGTYEKIKKGKSKKFSIDEKEHKITVTSIEENKVEVEIRSNPVKVELEIGEARKIDIDNDDYYELELKAQSAEDDEAEIYIRKIDEKICTPEWECSDWSSCDEGIKTRNCTDQNECGTEEGKPETEQECEETCEQNWTCTDWSKCVNGTQTRNCTDENNCEDDSNKPETEQECEVQVLKNCSELNGTLCNSTAICNGTTLNSSDDSVCCNVGCVFNNTENLCSEGYDYCDESEYCNASLEEGPGEPVCCSKECINLTSYLEEKPTNITYSKNLTYFQNNISNDCTGGYNIINTIEMDPGMLFGMPTGHRTKSKSYYELQGLNQQGNCTVFSNYTYYYMNYTQKLRDYMIQRGNTTEEIENNLEKENEKYQQMVGANAICHYPQDYMIEKIEGWKNWSFSSSSGDFEKYNCSGNTSAPMI